jgi:hypothetical protein
MTVKEVIQMLEEIAEKEGYNTECIVEIEQEDCNTEAEIHTVCTNGYQDGTKKICLLGTKDDEANEE